MDLRQILSELEVLGAAFPRRALEAAVARRREITPRLLAILKDAADRALSPARTDSAYMAHLYAMFLLAQFREGRARPRIVKFLSALAAAEDEVVEANVALLRPVLPRILASVADGRWTAFKELVEKPDLDSRIRSSGLEAMVLPVAWDEAPRDKVVAYFTTLFEDLERPSPVWTALVECAVRLHPGALLPRIEAAFEDGLVDTSTIDLDRVRQTAQRPSPEVVRSLRFDPRCVRILDAVDEMAEWDCFEVVPQRDSGASITAEPPAVGPASRPAKPPKRNDPCPCGSGKKWKKCCGYAGKLEIN